ncbi:MAG TPA: hypothetical protein VL137_16775 [Polyangiaceae bacterium]|nr:hypothetical protein [Polyangiaceae bacterium]
MSASTATVSEIHERSPSISSTRLRVEFELAARPMVQMNSLSLSSASAHIADSERGRDAEALAVTDYYY